MAGYRGKSIYKIPIHSASRDDFEELRQSAEFHVDRLVRFAAENSYGTKVNTLYFPRYYAPFWWARVYEPRWDGSIIPSITEEEAWKSARRNAKRSSSF